MSKLDHGLHLFYKDTESQEISDILMLTEQDQEIVAAMVEGVDSILELPIPIPIIFIDCDESNAFYQSEDQTIVLCYEMIAQSLLVYEAMDYKGAELSTAIVNNMIFILFHQMGHALIDILELPITDREEDAVDQFAVMSLLAFEELGQMVLYDFATFCLGMDELTESSIELIPFFADHFLNSERFDDILCLTYGSNPKAFSDMVDEGILSSRAAQDCPTEFKRVQDVWDELLEPYYKE